MKKMWWVCSSGKPEGKPRSRKEDTLKWILKIRCGILSDSIQGMEFLDKLGSYQLLEMKSVNRSQRTVAHKSTQLGLLVVIRQYQHNTKIWPNTNSDQTWPVSLLFFNILVDSHVTNGKTKARKLNDTSKTNRTGERPFPKQDMKRIGSWHDYTVPILYIELN
jgi:hypothetical protein